MDDILLFADDKPSLHRSLAEIRGFLADPLHLALKEQATRIAPVTEGIPFLGFRIYPGTIRLNQRTRRRFRCQVRAIERAYQAGCIDPRELTDRSASLFAHIGHADSYRLRRQAIEASIIDG